MCIIAKLSCDCQRGKMARLAERSELFFQWRRHALREDYELLTWRAGTGDRLARGRAPGTLEGRTVLPPTLHALPLGGFSTPTLGGLEICHNLAIMALNVQIAEKAISEGKGRLHKVVGIHIYCDAQGLRRRTAGYYRAPRRDYRARARRTKHYLPTVPSVCLFKCARHRL